MLPLVLAGACSAQSPSANLTVGANGAKLAGQQDWPSPASRDWLMLQFPDGVRGGRGRIHGEAAWSSGFTQEILLERIRECGASDLRTQELSHSLHVLSRSTPRDREIVACLKRTIPHHFSAGLGSGEPFQSSIIDHEPFREFATEPGNRSNKAH